LLVDLRRAGVGLVRLLVIAFGLIAVGLLLVVEDLRATNAG
jgi:hypothetical protein